MIDHARQRLKGTAVGKDMDRGREEAHVSYQYR
jgi:hypothetical protein